MALMQLDWRLSIGLQVHRATGELQTQYDIGPRIAMFYTQARPSYCRRLC